MLVFLEDDHMRTCLGNLLKNQGYQVVETNDLDKALIQLRQIDYAFLIYDSDSPGLEQEALTSTIRSLGSETVCVTTNEDEKASEVIDKIGFLNAQKVKNGVNFQI